MFVQDDTEVYTGRKILRLIQNDTKVLQDDTDVYTE
jgi:hypothetical protein